jgi:hypothetical protein
MVTPRSDSRSEGALAQLLQPERRLLLRLRSVFRLDPQVYEEIQADPAAIPQAFALVIITSILAGLGQGSIPGLFLGIVLAIVIWLVVTLLVWAVAVVWVRTDLDYSRLLRCTGFAYAWFALLIGYSLPFIGWLFGWSALGFCLASLVLAIRQVLQVYTWQALAICSSALGTPLLLLWWISR